MEQIEQTPFSEFISVISVHTSQNNCWLQKGRCWHTHNTLSGNRSPPQLLWFWFPTAKKRWLGSSSSIESFSCINKGDDVFAWTIQNDLFSHIKNNLNFLHWCLWVFCQIYVEYKNINKTIHMQAAVKRLAAQILGAFTGGNRAHPIPTSNSHLNIFSRQLLTRKSCLGHSCSQLPSYY